MWLDLHVLIRPGHDVVAASACYCYCHAHFSDDIDVS